MNENISKGKNLVKEFHKIDKEFEEKTTKAYSESLRKKYQIILKSIKDFLKSNQDQNYYVAIGEVETYIFTDSDEKTLSLVDSKKPYNNSILIEALITGLKKAWESLGEV